MACCCELQNTLDVEIGGSAGVLLQAKSVEVTENGTSVVAPDDGFDGLKSVEINTNVPKSFECGDGYFAPPASGGMGYLIRYLQKVDVSCWDTSKITTMYQVFGNCNSLQQLDVRGWDTSKVTNMDGLFGNCRSLQQLDVSSFDTSKVTNMSSIFGDCRSLQQLDVSSFDTSKVAVMYGIFYNCSSLQSLDLSGWIASSANSVNTMFVNCKSLRTLIGDKTLQDVENGLKTMVGLKLSIETKQSPLRFSSILALANGLADLTGATAQTLTISSGSYNNMYNDDDTVPTKDVIAERKARIAAICAAKNWNFAH